MKVVFVSNFFNHHQKPICEALYRHCGDEFRFISTTPVPQMRKNMGYQEEYPPYVLVAYTDPRLRTLAKALVDEADVVIAGSAPEALLRDRIRAGKLLFRYSERPLKEGFSWLKYIPRVIKWHMRSPMHKPIYMLCASAFTAPDYAKFGLFWGRCYKWGYFPETKRYEDPDGLMARKDTASILWVARLIELKHPEAVLEVAHRLRREGFAFRVTMIGIGPMEQQLREQIEAWGLSDCVDLPGAMKSEEVRAYMEKAGIYLFTSDRKEGWGAVLNESMNSGCAVIGSDAIGSVPYLLKHEENGLIYRSGDTEELYQQVKYLLEHPEAQRKLGMEAYRTITEEWNAEVAAERFLELARRMLAGEKKPDIYKNGPGSRHKNK